MVVNNLPDLIISVQDWVDAVTTKRTNDVLILTSLVIVELLVNLRNILFHECSYFPHFYS